MYVASNLLKLSQNRWQQLCDGSFSQKPSIVSDQLCQQAELAPLWANGQARRLPRLAPDNPEMRTLLLKAKRRTNSLNR
jgi:hypothetical protein